MHDPETPAEAELRRRAARRALWKGVALLVSSPLLVTLFVTPVIGAVLATIPQVAPYVPEPVRYVSITVDGLVGLAPETTEGADGDDDGVAMEPDAPTPAPLDAPTEEAAPDDGGDPADGAEAPDETPGADDAGKAPPAPKDPKGTAGPAEEAAPADAGSGEGTAEAPAEGAEDATGTAEGAKPPKKPGRSGKCNDTHPDIHKLAEDRWSVRRDLIDYYTATMERFNSLGYSHKWEDEAGNKGWQIAGFGCLSPLWKGGLRSQDVIQEVNGKRTYNVVQLFGIWISQRNKKEFEIKILRKGQPITLFYEIEV